jgi:hypothetical protein
MVEHVSDVSMEIREDTFDRNTSPHIATMVEDFSMPFSLSCNQSQVLDLQDAHLVWHNDFWSWDLHGLC